MPNSMVIDLSHWQTIPSSLVPAKNHGVVGVIHKATEGSGYRDDKLEARRHLAKEAGLLFGAYHFLRPGDMEQQAEFFVSAAGSGILYAADHEDERVSLDSLEYWLEEVEKLTGIRPVIYSGHVLKQQLKGKRHPKLNQDNYRLWMPQYGPTPELPPGWDRYFLWQWTEDGTIPGINPPTDLNDYQGSPQQLEREWGSDTGGGGEPVTILMSPQDLQAALKKAGYYHGEEDGLWGPQTRRAIGDWFAEADDLEVVVD